MISFIYSSLSVASSGMLLSSVEVSKFNDDSPYVFSGHFLKQPHWVLFGEQGLLLKVSYDS